MQEEVIPTPFCTFVAPIKIRSVHLKGHMMIDSFTVPHRCYVSFFRGGGRTCRFLPCRFPTMPLGHPNASSLACVRGFIANGGHGSLAWHLCNNSACMRQLVRVQHSTCTRRRYSSHNHLVGFTSPSGALSSAGWRLYTCASKRQFVKAALEALK